MQPFRGVYMFSNLTTGLFGDCRVWMLSVNSLGQLVSCGYFYVEDSGQQEQKCKGTCITWKCKCFSHNAGHLKNATTLMLGCSFK